MPYSDVAGLLTDIGTEELAHMELVSSMIRQLTRSLTDDQIQNSGFYGYYVDHGPGIWPMSSGGVPFSSVAFQSKGDCITDLTENLAADATIL